MVIVTPADSATSSKRSRSRRINVDLVMMLMGVRARSNPRKHACVSRRRASSG